MFDGRLTNLRFTIDAATGGRESTSRAISPGGPAWTTAATLGSNASVGTGGVNVPEKKLLINSIIGRSALKIGTLFGHPAIKRFFKY